MKGEIWDDEINNYKNDESNQTFLLTMGVNPSIIPKVGKADAFYQQSNVPNPFNFEPNASTIWGYDIGIEVSSSVMLLYKSRTNYIYDIVSETYEAIESLQIETKIIF